MSEAWVDSDAAIKAEMEYVVRVARWFSRGHRAVEFEELVSVGYVALAECLLRFDASRGVSFRGYLGGRVRGAMLDHCRGVDPLSRHHRREVGNDFSATEQFAEETLVGVRDVSRGPRLSEVAADTPDPARVVLMREVRELMEKMPPKWRQAIEARLQELPLAGVARAMGVSASRVAQLHQQGVKWLRQKVSI